MNKNWQIEYFPQKITTSKVKSSLMILEKNKTENPFSLQDDEKIDTTWQYLTIPKFLLDDHPQ